MIGLTAFGHGSSGITHVWFKPLESYTTSPGEWAQGPWEEVRERTPLQQRGREFHVASHHYQLVFPETVFVIFVVTIWEKSEMRPILSDRWNIETSIAQIYSNRTRCRLWCLRSMTPRFPIRETVRAEAKTATGRIDSDRWWWMKNEESWENKKKRTPLNEVDREKGCGVAENTRRRAVVLPSYVQYHWQDIEANNLYTTIIYSTTMLCMSQCTVLVVSTYTHPNCLGFP